MPVIDLNDLNDTRGPLAGLQRRIRIFELVGIMVTALLVSAITLIPAYRQGRDQADLSLDFHVRSQAQAANQLFVNFGNVAAQLTSRSQIRDALDEYDRGLRSEDEVRAFSSPRLSDALAQSPEVLGLHRLDRAGRVIVRLGAEIPQSSWHLPPDDDEAPLERHGPFVVGGRAAFVISAPILSRDGRRIGTDLVAFDLSRLQWIVSESLPLPGDARVYLAHLVDGTVAQLAGDGAGFRKLGADDPLRRTLLDMARLPARAAPLPGDGHRLSFSGVLPDLQDWALVVSVERSALYAPAARALYLPVAAIVLLIMASAVLMFLAVRPLSRRLADQAQRLTLAASVFESSNEGIVLLDASRHIVQLNPAGARMLRLTAAEAQGQGFCDFSLPEGRLDRCDAVWVRSDQSGQWQGELPLRRADGEEFVAWLSLASMRDAEGRVTHYSGIFTDITARKAIEAHIRRLAYYDELTGLPNRTLLQDRLDHALRQARRGQGRVAILFMDLDGFKAVNDTHGHAAGDRLLQAVGRRLLRTVRDEDTVARLGGDEFVVLLEGVESAESAATVASKVVSNLSAPFTQGEHEIRIGVSVGISLFPGDAGDAESLVRCADEAMYAVKQRGRNGYGFYVREGRTPGPEPLAGASERPA